MKQQTNRILEDQDMWDPNTWVRDEHEFRIYGNDQASVWAVVDEEDYQYLVQWRWSVKASRGGRKFYFFRSAYAGGRYLRQSIYMHVLIQERKFEARPSPRHTIADHRDGDSFNCRRNNLRWATPSMNSLNVFGSHPHDLVEG